jgi:hypothetical protein
MMYNNRGKSRLGTPDAKSIEAGACRRFHCPLMFGDSHLLGGASSGAFWCIGGKLCIKNNILGNELGGYTGHQAFPFSEVRSGISHTL